MRMSHLKVGDDDDDDDRRSCVDVVRSRLVLGPSWDIQTARRSRLAKIEAQNQ